MLTKFIEDPKTEDIPETFEVDLPILEPENELELEEKERLKSRDDLDFL